MFDTFPSQERSSRSNRWSLRNIHSSAFHVGDGDGSARLTRPVTGIKGLVWNVEETRNGIVHLRRQKLFFDAEHASNVKGLLSIRAFEKNQFWSQSRLSILATWETLKHSTRMRVNYEKFICIYIYIRKRRFICIEVIWFFFNEDDKILISTGKIMTTIDTSNLYLSQMQTCH